MDQETRLVVTIGQKTHLFGTDSLVHCVQFFCNRGFEADTDHVNAGCSHGLEEFSVLRLVEAHLYGDVKPRSHDFLILRQLSTQTQGFTPVVPEQIVNNKEVPGSALFEQCTDLFHYPFHGRCPLLALYRTEFAVHVAAANPTDRIE